MEHGTNGTNHTKRFSFYYLNINTVVQSARSQETSYHLLLMKNRFEKDMLELHCSAFPSNWMSNMKQKWNENRLHSVRHRQFDWISHSSIRILCVSKIEWKLKTTEHWTLNKHIKMDFSLSFGEISRTFLYWTNCQRAFSSYAKIPTIASTLNTDAKYSARNV